MKLFVALFLIVLLQRGVELSIAKRNERSLKAYGGIEKGQSHYHLIVGLHIAFFVSLLLEVLFIGARPAPWYWIPLGFFLLAQIIRVWALTSLGVFWNTKIIVLPGADIVTKGPYKYVKHPNYLVVAVEILTLPLIFQTYLTAIVFTVLNAVLILGVRIPEEERALRGV